jgi:hypothetical protein
MNAEFLSKLSLVRSAYPTWDFDRSFQYLMAQEKHTGTFGRPKANSGDAILVAQAKDGQKPAPKPDEVVAAYTHPFEAEAERRGITLVCGGWYVPLPGHG